MEKERNERRVMIGQVPTTQKDNERKKASRRLVAFPKAPPHPHLTPFDADASTNDRVRVLFHGREHVGIATINSRRMETRENRRVAPQSSFAFSTRTFKHRRLSCKMYIPCRSAVKPCLRC